MGTARQFFNSLKKGMEEFGKGINVLVNLALLTLVYAIGIGLTSIAAKIIGKRFLETEIKKKGTYWEALNLKKQKREEYYKQF